MTLDCVVVGFCLWKERWLRSCRTSQQTCHNIPSYCNTHVFRRDIHMSVCSELMLRGFAANQLNNEILALKWGPFAFFISGSMHNERMMRNANLKIRVVFKKMCFHVAATRRCAIHLTNTYNILQHLTTVYNILQLFSCFSFVAWISLLQGELSLHEDWFWSLEVLQQPPIHTK